MSGSTAKSRRQFVEPIVAAAVVASVMAMSASPAVAAPGAEAAGDEVVLTEDFRGAVNSDGERSAPVSVTATPGVPGIKGFAKTLNAGNWDAGHVQGIAVDADKGRIYYSFTTMLVKTDLAGNVLGTVSGFTGHLGDLDLNEADGRVYGSLEYKAQEAFYIAILDVDKVDRIGMDAEDAAIVTTVHLDEVVDDYSADMDQNGVFDGNIGNTPDHRYGSSGIDGVSFGPKFGSNDGAQYLTVAYGVYSNVGRTDNDNQVLLQYDTSGWGAYERPLVEADPHRSGPDTMSGKYFVRTGNTSYGVQNLEYDAFLGRWFMGVYKGSKPQFPNYTLFAIDAATQPVLGELEGTGGDTGLLIDLAQDGLVDPATDIHGWVQKADVGMESLGDGLFYLARNSVVNGRETADITLHRWTGNPAEPFVPVNDESELHRAPAFTSPAPAAATTGTGYSHTFSASAFPEARFTVSDGNLPRGIALDEASGVLSGTPVDPGVVEFAVTAENGVGEPATQQVALTVDAGVGGGLGSLGSLGALFG
ncbi:Ig domain-containing protein [Tomitella biformata]|uniref:Ig domain-containing protein n=1 Tax=Tomitella biformata TaxID=630403 RepID=UPI0011DD7EF6|nr:Ig domain-containing protein [Tomitella biformata]